MVTADFNGDRKLHIAVAGEDDNADVGIAVGIHRGIGNATFAAFERFPTKGDAGLQVIAVGDFDHNGGPDLVTVGSFDKWATVLLPEPALTGLLAAGLTWLVFLARRRP